MVSAFLYPGQGSQAPGMAKDLFEASPGVKELFAAADEATGLDMKALLFEADAEALKQTEAAQPAITLASLAAFTVLKERGLESNLTAGHSLGEYAALVDAGVLEAFDALKLVRLRGLAMAKAAAALAEQDGNPGMAAVLGLDPAAVAAGVEGIEGVWPANFNSAKQTVISGTAEGLEAATAALKEAGAKRIIPLKVSGPFHSPLLVQAAEEFGPALEAVNFADPAKTVYANVTAEPVRSGDEARDLLLKQITSPVRWTEIEAAMTGGDAPDRALEAGPGSVLAGLWKQANPLGG